MFTSTRNGTRNTKIRASVLALCLGLFFSLGAQCDLEIVGVDLLDGDITVAFNNTENCGGSSSPTGVSEIQFGFQALDADCNAMNIGWDFPSGFSIPDDSNHPGWMYSPTTSSSIANWTNLYDDLSPPYYSGDTVSFPIYNPYLEDCSPSQYTSAMWCFMEDNLQYWLDQGLSIQVVIWQISYGPTMYADMGGWAEVGPNGDGSTWGSGEYEDENFQDNWVVIGGCGTPLPEVVYDTVYVYSSPDTVYITLTDTVYVTEYQVDTLIITEVDTSYITLTDTTYITEYQVDTAYITISDTVWWTVYETDTAYTYEYDMVEVDCVTGLPCINPFSECSIYIPNSFTPDGDGVNDVWGAETDSDCWKDWRMRVFSRGGEVVWESFSPDDLWIGGDAYYVPDDMYIYRVECEGYGESYIINGHVTIVR